MFVYLIVTIMAFFVIGKTIMDIQDDREKKKIEKTLEKVVKRY